MKEAIDNTKIILGEQYAVLAQRWFEKADRMNKSDRVFRRIAFAKDKEQLLDYLAEIRYALIFAGLGFFVEFEPAGNRGPDLGIERDNEEVVVEIMRFRKTNSDLLLLNFDDDNFTLPEYGNIQLDSRKTFGKILKKFRQVKNQQGIIAIWNDDNVLDEIEALIAVNWINKDIKSGLLIMPNNLLFILYGSKWQLGNNQLYCFPFQNLEKTFESWKIELEKATVFYHIEEVLSNS